MAEHPDERRVLGGHPGDREAGVTITRKNATGPASTVNWKGSVIVRGKRGKAGIEIGTEETETGGGPAAQTGTKNGESAEKAAAAAGTKRASVETKRETAGMTGTGGRRGSIIKTGAQRERGPGTRRAGENLTTDDTKRTGTGTRGRPRGQAGVEAGTGSIKAAGRRKLGNEIAAAAEIESERETEISDPTNGAAAKRGATTSESPATITVNTANVGGVEAPSKKRFLQHFYFCVILPPSSRGCPISAKMNASTGAICLS